MANKDTLIKMFEGIRDERTKHANTARRIGNAFLSMLDFASSAGDGKLSSVHDDIAQGFITFVKGLMSNQLAQLKGGASFGSDGSYSFDKDGNLVIESAHSRDFDEMLQNGFALKRNPTSGKYTLSISDLIVWGRMVINTLEIRKKYAIGGNVYLSGASSKIQHVEKAYSEDGETVVGYKCYILKDDGTMATQNNWVVGDQALCQTFDIEEGVYQNVSNQYYWRLVTQVSEENVAITEKYTDKDGNEQIRELYEGQKFAWVVLSKDDCDTNSGIPASGDTIVLDGHRLTENEDTDYTERTNVLMLEATGSGSPRIIALTGVVDYKHTTDNEVFILSPRKVIFTTEHFEIRTASGAPITFVHFMGPWMEGTEYHYYDQVSHANALWTCIVEKGKSTTDEPADGSPYWRKEMSGGKGEKGDDAVSYNINFVTHKDDAHNDTILYVYVVRSVGKESTSTLISNIPEISETTGLEVRVYCDGDYNENLTNHVKWSGSIQRSAWETVKNFEVRLYLNDKLVTSNSYSYGEQGTDGKDAISILVEDAPLVFDTDDNGTVSSDVTKTAKVKVMKGNTNVTNDCTSESSRDDLSSNCMSSVKKDKDNECINVSIQGNWISKNDVIVDGVNQGQVSATSGYAVAQFVYAGVVYFAQVPFSVNVAKFTGAVAFDNKSYKIQFDELSKNAATKDELKNATSTFEQTAREISLSVSEKSIGRRNLLVGSAFLREDNHVEINEARIEMNTGYQGTNCIRISDDTTDGKTRYPGAFWDGSQGGKSVRITKGKKYVISCWYYTNDTNGHLSLEALYTDKQTNAERKGAPKYLSAGNLVPKPNQWQLFTTVIDTTDAEYDYIAFNFYEYCSVESGLIEAYICRPMIEEGDTYNGWTLSQDDYDIIGANLIDNSRTLDVGDNVLEVKGQKALVGDAYELTYIGSDDYNTFYRIKGSTFKLGVDYTISFEVRGDAEYMGVYAYYPITNTKFTFYAEPQNGAMTEVTDVGKVNNYVALIQVRELSKQQRVWSHFRFKDRLPEHIYFQFPKNAEQTGVTSWNVTITKPKIEVGAVVTEYTERKSDLVDKASLKAAGIEITSEKVKLYGDQIEFAQTKSGTAFAMFKDGMLDARLINAAKIIAERLETSGNTGQRVAIEDGLMQIFGTNGVCNIKFGVNDNGEAILSYYDKNGKWLYDLGPNKLDGSQITSSAVTIKEYVKATIKPGTNDFYDNVTYLGKGVKQVKFQYSQLLFGNNIFMNEDDEIKKNSSAHIGYQPFANESNVTKLYRYSAPRMGNNIVKDDKYGLSTVDLAKRADGKYFTSMTMASGGSLVNLAPVGVYFGKNEAVRYALYPNASVGSTNDRFPAFTIGGLEISKAGVGSSIGAYNGFYSYLTRKVTNLNTDIIS